MKKQILILIIMSTPLIILAQTPPLAKKKPQKMTMHGDTRIDNYYWLNQRENPEVIKYLEAENAYCDAEMKSTVAFQDKLYNEMIGRIKQDDESLPTFKNGYWSYTRFETGKEYPIICRKKSTLDAHEEVLLNVNDMAEGFKYYQVGGAAVSPDNRLLAYSVDTVSRRNYTIYVKNLETGETYADKIDKTAGGVVWGNDNQTFFYVRKNEQTLRSEKVYRHTLGQPADKDQEVFFEADETYSISLGKTKSEQYIIIESGSTLSSEVRILDANTSNGEFTIFNAREKDHLYSIDHYKDRFYIVTNWNAKNFRLMTCSLDKTSKNAWKEQIPHRSDVLLEGIELFANYLVLSERSKGLTQVRILDQRSNEEHYLSFEEPAYVAGVGYNPEFNTDVLRFNYNSLSTPGSTFDYNMQTRERQLKKEQPVLGGFNKDNYVTERLWATAKDGTKIPISLVYKKGFKKDGNAPLWLYAYGSYGISTDPGFSSTRLSMLDRGFVYAIAHIRGGQEMGRQWYEDGKMFKKKNTFTDFIDCAEFLINNKYTNKNHLYASGGSAGGLLMGAIVNMRPDLWKGVIAAVPFVDVVTTMLDETIPLTTSEFDEWGNPKNKESYVYMKSYSPYDNVERKNYPNLLVTSGLHDSQVQYFEPAKWVAKLRVMKTDKNKLLFHCDMAAGHGGTSGRFKRLKQTALEYAFMLNLEGIKQ